ncbi:GNAT family N-acetyltransferase [Desulfobaculum bizertense]|uniref:Acetyltransferase (GNAT) family protein n=1 Tax=Desulfobaculum bizertense DSM 18034 TaxID=1121442 RepID=A0A1T4WG80_9BACT|nr:GNAT family N-acetyltransferase [Desulfobaculum bizertense]UIJ39420.1 GNAT family N-acetyltransferase [Desulfobaculum bizertense]SKA76346.1 Acetyltransferase (GNAT) family protein [Desulfobaculum bizertense DSM 18034]
MDYSWQVLTLSEQGDDCGRWLLAKKGVSGASFSLNPVFGVREDQGIFSCFDFPCKGFELHCGERQLAFGRELFVPEPLRGRGVGSYLLRWLAGQALDAGLGAERVRSLHLISRQNTELRNAFYERLGFELTVYRDGSGWARLPQLKAMQMQPSHEKVRPVLDEEPRPVALQNFADMNSRLLQT